MAKLKVVPDRVEERQHLPEVKKNYGVLKNYINGEWVDAEASKLEDVENPATGEIIAQVPLSTARETAKAVEAAQEAWLEWRETPPVTRVRYFFKLRDLMVQHFENISRVQVQ